MAQHARDRDHGDGAVRPLADRRGTASTTSTASSPARPRSGSRGSIENLNPVEPPHDEKYHLTEDLADKAIAWLRKHQAFAPDKPFLMYWAPGAAHGPHHIFKEWADKYKGKFDDGWDELPRARLRASEGAGLDSRRRQAHAARRDAWPRGTASRRRSGRSSGG